MTRYIRKIRTAAAILTAFVLLAAVFPAITVPQAASDGLFIDFEDGTAMGFGGRGTADEIAGGTGVFTVVTEEARSGQYSLLTTERKAAWNGPSLNVTEYVIPDIYYEVSVWVLPKTPETSNFKLSTQVGQGGSAEYFNIEIKEVSVSDGWTELSGRFTYSADEFITIYVENDTVDAEFYIDDISFAAPAGSDDILESIALPSLRETYKDHFLLGTAYSRQDLSGNRFELVKRHFNVMTAGNAMKPNALGGRNKGGYTFDNADAMLDIIEEAGMLSHGHALLWHAQSADWLNKNPDGSPLTRAEARANMEDFVNTVAGHYAGRVISWDVLNEAFTPGVDVVPDNWRDALRKGGDTNENSPWYAAYENGADFAAGENGADYIYDAFVFSRLADPNAILYYNDFNEEYPAKREVIAMMTEELNKQWETDPRNEAPGRLLVEGLGLQAHYWTDALDPQNVEDTIIRWAATGAELSVTELDIPAGSWVSYKELTEAESEKQATLYAKLFQIFKRHSDSIERVTLWGIDDPTSWRSGGSPLLFGENTEAKPAFYAVIDPDGYLDGKYDNLSQTDEAEPDEPPVEDSPAPAGESPAPQTSGPDSNNTDADGSESSVPALFIIIGAVLGTAAIAAVAVILISRLRKPR